MPATNFPFDEAAWTAEDDAALGAWTPGQPTPPRWTELQARLEQAMNVEAARRHVVGDVEALRRFWTGRARWGFEWERNPSFREQCQQEAIQAVRRGEDWGFWRWIPPVQARAFLSFLRGEPPDEAYVRGPAEPTPPVHLFPFEEGWRTDDDLELYLRHGLGGPLPAVWDETWSRLESAILIEKENRTAQGDTGSVARFDAERARLAAQWRESPLVNADMLNGLGQGGGFWRWVDAPIARLVVGFVRGEPIGAAIGSAVGEDPTPEAVAADGHGSIHALTPVDPVASAEPSDSPPVPPPERWGPQWGPDDNAAMEAWKGRDPEPAGYARAEAGMNAAIRREKLRRRELGDEASSDWFDRERERLAAELDEPEVDEEWRRKLEEARARGDLGFWDWSSPPIARLTRAFLRGEGCRPTKGDPG